MLSLSCVADQLAIAVAAQVFLLLLLLLLLTSKCLRPVDFMINLHMLVWGAANVKKLGGYTNLVDMDPAENWMSMAEGHARQVAANHVRPDGSTFHIVE